MSAPNNTIFDSDLRVRMNQQDLDTFITNTQVNIGKPYQVVIREIVTAFNDDRLRIIPTKDQEKSLKSLGDLYNVNRK